MKDCIEKYKKDWDIALAYIALIGLIAIIVFTLASVLPISD